MAFFGGVFCQLLATCAEASQRSRLLDVDLATGALTIALPGCGGSAPEKGASGEDKIIPAVNPAPGTVPLEDKYKSQQAKTKAK